MGDEITRLKSEIVRLEAELKRAKSRPRFWLSLRGLLLAVFLFAILTATVTIGARGMSLNFTNDPGNYVKFHIDRDDVGFFKFESMRDISGTDKPWSFSAGWHADDADVWQYTWR